MDEKLEKKIREGFESLRGKAVIIAFSGGVDSIVVAVSKRIVF